jgi:choline kinase
MRPDDADGENLGIVKFGPQGATELVEIMDRLVAAGGLREWAPRAFDAFAQVRPLHAIGTRGFPWIEIDFPEDYQRAVREVLPQIDLTTEDVGAPDLSAMLPVFRPSSRARKVPAAAELR